MYPRKYRKGIPWLPLTDHPTYTSSHSWHRAARRAVPWHQDHYHHHPIKCLVDPPSQSRFSDIHLSLMSFPSRKNLPEGCENTPKLPSVDYLVPSHECRQRTGEALLRHLQEMIDCKSRPLCVIPDFFLGWTLGTGCEFDIPRLVCHGMSVLSMAICKISVEGQATPYHLPENCRFLEDDWPFPKFVEESGLADIGSNGVDINSFAELEGHHLPFIEQFYKKGAKGWCVGPAQLYNQKTNDSQNVSPSTNNQRTCL